MTFVIGSFVFFGALVVDFIFSLKMRSMGIPELFPLLRDSDKLFSPVRYLIASGAVYAFCAILHGIGGEQYYGLGWALILVGVGKLVGSGFNYSKSK